MKCPKCGQQQETSSSCLSCGIVFAKYFEIQERRKQKSAPAEESKNEPVEQNEIDPLPMFPLENNDVMAEEGGLTAMRRAWFLPWKPVTNLSFGGLSFLFGLMIYLLAKNDLMAGSSKLLWLTHNVNLVFHEAGHLIFGIFGNYVLTVFGGSLNQILIPLIVAAAFWVRRDTLGFAFGLFWCFENFLDVAVYMADARALQLPLIGDHGPDAHDWRNLFFRFGLIDQDTLIAGRTAFVGWCGMIGTWIWLAWQWRVGNAHRKNEQK
jgi:hypothetical protein